MLDSDIWDWSWSSTKDDAVVEISFWPDRKILKRSSDWKK